MKTKKELLKEYFESNHKELVENLTKRIDEANLNGLSGIVFEKYYQTLSYEDRFKFKQYIKSLGYRYFLFPLGSKIEINWGEGDDWVSRSALDYELRYIEYSNRFEHLL